jgi:hypothetical protein
MNSEALRKQYGLRANPINDPIKEQEWNELARLFVQRFQQIHNLPHDSLAGVRSFLVLDATGVGKHAKT